jgi:glycosyltransferase involved in cell wall biosynthesis
MHLVIVTSFPPSRASLCEYAEHLVRALAQRPEVTRLSVIADQLPNGIQEARLPGLEHVEVHRVWRFNDLRNAARINRTIQKIKPDGVLYNLQFASFGNRPAPASLGLFAPAITRLQGTPTITLLHNLIETVDLELAGFGANRLRNTAIRLGGKMLTRAVLGSHRVAVTMPRYQDILESSYRARNVFHAPHGTFQRTQPLPFPSKRTVLAFGKFGTYKRLETLLQAHAMLLEHNPDTHLVIAGTDSPNAPGYLERIQREYPATNVTYTGYVPESQVRHVFAKASTVVFPYSSTTGSSGVLHQAGEFSRGAVLPLIGDLADLITDEGYQAEFFEPEHPASLARALERALDPERALGLGMNNHAAAMNLLLENVVEKYIAAFAEIRKPKPQHGPQQNPAPISIPDSPGTWDEIITRYLKKQQAAQPVHLRSSQDVISSRLAKGGQRGHSRS